MKNLFPAKLKLFGKKSRCLVIAGDDIRSLANMFSQQEQERSADSLHVYQLLHNPQLDSFNIVKQQAEQTVLSFNLHDIKALQQCMAWIERHHCIDLCIVQPTFISDENIAQIAQADIEQHWQNSGLNAVNIAQGMLRHMLKNRQGSIIFVGERPENLLTGHLLSVSLNASIRALSQSLAREFQPKGIHVVYLMLQHWDSDDTALVSTIKQTCWHLYQQPKSTWSQEFRVGALL